MKMKLLHRQVKSFHTLKPSVVDMAMTEAEKVNLPESIHRVAWDIAETVAANNGRKDGYQTPALIASYILRYAFNLAQAGELVEAPPKPPRPKKEKPAEGQPDEGGAEA